MVRVIQGPVAARTVGKISLKTRLDHGLIMERVSSPIGVLLIIFEARPEVIANIASLAIKSGNAAILKGKPPQSNCKCFMHKLIPSSGGKESTASFKAIATAVASALETTKVPNASIQLVTTRDAIASLLDLDSYIDLVIPRGSNELVRYVKDNTRIPVLGHADGLCSIYIHEDAEPDMAKRVLLDAKLGYPAACNAVETLLVHEHALANVLPSVASALLERGASLRCDEPSKSSLAKSLPSHHAAILQDAHEEDYETEFLAPILAIQAIPSSSPSPDALELAIMHINTHGSHHTDCILTQDSTIARRFQSSVDSACVFWNTSTRMSDGMRFGFGTEVGISTNKIHARGPVGLEGLMIYKYLVSGEGQVAGDYGSVGKKWLHEKMNV